MAILSVTEGEDEEMSTQHRQICMFVSEAPGTVYSFQAKPYGLGPRMIADEPGSPLRHRTARGALQGLVGDYPVSENQWDECPWNSELDCVLHSLDMAICST